MYYSNMRCRTVMLGDKVKTSHHINASHYMVKKIDTLQDIVYTGDVYIQGCHIVAGKEKWKKLQELMFANLKLALGMNLSDDDQTFLLMAYLSAPQYFELHYNSPDDWFRIFKDYNNA